VALFTPFTVESWLHGDSQRLARYSGMKGRLIPKMYTTIITILHTLGLEQNSSLIAYAALVAIGFFVCFFLRGMFRWFAARILRRFGEDSPRVRVIVDSLLVKRASNIIIPITVILLVRELTERYAFLHTVAEVSFAVAVMLILFSCVKCAGMILDSVELHSNVPVHGILQGIMVIISIVGAIVIIAILIGQSPAVLLGSLGAMMAIITLIFKDTLLGFVAGIQLTTNDMLRIGDWIEMPDQSANGFVIDLSLTTVKVENFDKTITSVPAYNLIVQPFINWRGMLDAGGRRIKRALHIDSAMVRFCDDGMIERFQGFALLREHMEGKLADIAEYNAALDCDLSLAANGRRLTNIGVFRAYITAYLRQHPGIRQDLTLVVRQLDPGENGIPMEIIAFAAATSAVDFEPIQADIFDHLYAVISEFELSLYQNPSGSDVRRVGTLGRGNG